MYLIQATLTQNHFCASTSLCSQNEEGMKTEEKDAEGRPYCFL